MMVARKAMRPGMSNARVLDGVTGLLEASSELLFGWSTGAGASSSCGGDEDGISCLTITRQTRTIGTWHRNDLQHCQR